MSETTREILQRSLALPAPERAVIIQELLRSLDRPDAEVDAMWAQEAEERLAAFDAGKVKAIPAEDVFDELERS